MILSLNFSSGVPLVNISPVVVVCGAGLIALLIGITLFKIDEVNKYWYRDGIRQGVKEPKAPNLNTDLAVYRFRENLMNTMFTHFIAVTGAFTPQMILPMLRDSSGTITTMMINGVPVNGIIMNGPCGGRSDGYGTVRVVGPIYRTIIAGTNLTTVTRPVAPPYLGRIRLRYLTDVQVTRR